MNKYINMISSSRQISDYAIKTRQKTTHIFSDTKEKMEGIKKTLMMVIRVFLFFDYCLVKDVNASLELKVFSIQTFCVDNVEVCSICYRSPCFGFSIPCETA